MYTLVIIRTLLNQKLRRKKEWKVNPNQIKRILR